MDSLYSMLSLYALLGTLFISTLLHLYLRHKFKYWGRRGVAGPHFTLYTVFYNIYQALTTPLHIIWKEGHNLYGNFYGVYEFTKPTLVVSDPDMIRDIMVKHFHSFPDHRLFFSGNKYFDGSLFSLRGENWKNVRNLMTPTFTSGKMRKMYRLMNDCVEDAVQVLGEKAETEGCVDLRVLFGNYTLDVIARCCFATNANIHKDADNEFSKNAKEVLKIKRFNLLLLFLLPDALFRYLNIALFSRKPTGFFRSVTLHLIGERKEKRIKKNDFLQQLIDAEHDPSDGLDENIDENINENKDEDDLLIGNNGLSEQVVEATTFKKKRLDEDEIVSQSFIFFFAGYETTSTLLQYIFYFLSLHPEIQEKLLQEIKEAMDSNNELSHDVLRGLPYLNAVVSETLRFYPPLSSLDRQTVEDCKLEKTGTYISKGTVVTIPIYAIHHDPENFPEPEEFRPERFLPENKEDIKPFTYMPFGAGPRQCIAYRFALLETKLAVAKVVLSFKFTRIAKTDVPPKFVTGLGLLQCNGISVGIEKRH